MESVKKSIGERTQHKTEYESRVNERQIQKTEEKTDTSNALDALDASSVIIENNGTESKEQDTSSRSGNDAHDQSLESENVVLKKDRCPLQNILEKIEAHKTFASSTTKVESEPPNGSNADITNQCESKQALNVSAAVQASVINVKRRLIIADQASVFMAMMSDHNSSDLAPQRQEMSVENVSSGLVPQGQKASDYDNSDPVPPRQNVVPTAEKTDSSQQGLEFLFSPLLEEYYNPTHGLAEENNNDQAPNASFQEAEFINPFCTRVQEIGESSSRNIDNTDVHSFQPQSHDYRWTRDHPLEQVRGNPSMPVQTRRQLATDPEMCMFALTVSIVEPKNIKEAMADSAWIEAMQDELHQFDRLKVWELVDKPFGKMKKLKCCSLGSSSGFVCHVSTQGFSKSSDDVKTAFLNGPLKEDVYDAQPDWLEDQIIHKRLPTQESFVMNKATPRAWILAFEQTAFSDAIMRDALILGKALLEGSVPLV
ncbi:hypothetical protein Tco_0194485 [Tanacetum coccineum]